MVLTRACFLRRSGGIMFDKTGSEGRGVDLIVPLTILKARFSQTGQQYYDMENTSDKAAVLRDAALAPQLVPANCCNRLILDESF